VRAPGIHCRVHAGARRGCRKPVRDATVTTGVACSRVVAVRYARAGKAHKEWSRGRTLAIPHFILLIFDIFLRFIIRVLLQQRATLIGQAGLSYSRGVLGDMDLLEFAKKHLDEENGILLPTSGTFALRLSKLVRDEERTASLIATQFWRAFLASEATRGLEKKLDLRPGALFRAEKMVICRSALRRFDLVILAPDLSGISSSRVTVTPDEILEGWYRWTSKSGARATDYNNPNLALDAFEMGQPFAILAARAPIMEPAHAPSKSCEVDPGTGSSSSAGVVVKDKAGRQGVTAALHAVGSATTVKVDGNSGSIIKTDQMSDGCFIELHNLPAVGTKGANGALSGILPRGSQSASFEGFSSGKITTSIIAWSPELPDLQSYNQLKVYTKNDVNPGDSGTALITDDDYVAGFAFERGQTGAAIEYSSWIWADAVMQALGLEFL
jgi:hypothetical protein